MSDSLTLGEVARRVLQRAQAPLSAPEVWAAAETIRLTAKLGVVGKTPWASLGSLLYVETKENPSSELLRVGRRPLRFWLRARALPRGWSATGPSDDVERAEPQPTEVPGERRFLVRDLHPLFAWFARTQLNGVRVRTIRHSASARRSFGEWVHPDLVGVRLPISFLERPTVEFAGAVRAPTVRLFAFERKRSVDFSNLRESCFQAVSNSSWAHEGYLVAARWADDGEFDDELARLSQSFGIGAIHIDLDDPSASRVLHTARVRDEIDWVTLDKLVAMNPDVAQFSETVKIDLNANRIHDGEYDGVPTDVEAYVKGLAAAPARAGRGRG